MKKDEKKTDLGNSINLKSTFIANTVLLIQMLGLVYFSFAFAISFFSLINIIIKVPWRHFVTPMIIIIGLLILITIICLLTFAFFFFWPGKKKYFITKQGNSISVNIPNRTVDFELNQISKIESLTDYYTKRFNKKLPIGVSNNAIFLWRVDDLLYFASPDSNPDNLYTITFNKSFKPSIESKQFMKKREEPRQLIIDIPDIDVFLKNSDIQLSGKK